MNIHVLTLFPEAFPGTLGISIIGKAFAKGICKLYVHDLKPFGQSSANIKSNINEMIKNQDSDPNKTSGKNIMAKNMIAKNIIDDKPYGGGAGMVIKCEPVDKAIRELKLEDTYKIFTSPSGYKFSHSIAKAMTKVPKDLLFLCGRYEGVDQRVLEKWDFKNMSIGDYVLCGGEVAAQVMIESIVRLTEGVVGKQESVEYDSFSPGLDGEAEHPQYTTPAVWEGRHVPEALLSGDHARIKAYNSAMRKMLRKMPQD